MAEARKAHEMEEDFIQGRQQAIGEGVGKETLLLWASVFQPTHKGHAESGLTDFLCAHIYSVIKSFSASDGESPR
jgi:hypothetical protein